MLRRLFFLFILFCNTLFIATAQFHPFHNASPEYTLKTIQLSTGMKLHYAEQGDSEGVPVIFLHGLSDSWYSFEQVLTFLPPSVHGFSISLRGHGNSDKPEEGYNPSNMAADIAVFMQQLKIGSAVIVGHSMGSVIAQRFVLDYPALSKALVLIGAFASFSDKPGMLEFNATVNQLQNPVDSSFIYEFQKSTLANEISPLALNTYVKESHKLPARVWKDVMQGLMAADYQYLLKDIQIPTLIIWGDKDVFATETDQYKLLSGINNSQLIVYSGTGHAVHWEQPIRFTNDVLNFMNKHL